MAAGNPVCATDLFGEQYTFWTDGFEVWFSSYIAGDENLSYPLGKAPNVAFEQPVADGAIDVLCDSRSPVWIGGVKVVRSGISVTYLDASGNRCSKISSLDGDAGSWQDVAE